jgi:hypothetical protein
VFPPRVHSWSNFNFDFLFKYSQSEKFDPDGVYIRRWVPELAGLKTAKAVHNPHSVLSKKEIAAMGYRDTPIVEHKVARERAIEAFKLVLGKGMKIPNPKSSQGYGNHDYEEMETKGNSEKSKEPPAIASRNGKKSHGLKNGDLTPYFKVEGAHS